MAAKRHENIEATLVALDRAALDRWAAGGPDGVLGLYDEAVGYFDPFHQRHVDGLPAMRWHTTEVYRAHWALVKEDAG